jgi:drug/metabolite transporter (DMT)-like permease
MSKRGWVLFAAMSVIWGIPYLLIKVAVRELSPAMLVFCRTGIGAAVLVPVALARHELRPVLGRWRAVAAYTVAELAIPWVLLSQAERRLPSSLSGLLVAAVPLVGALLAWVVARGDHDRVGGRGMVGLVVGLAGVAVLVGFDVSAADLRSVALVGVVVLGYALGPLILARALSDLPALGVVSASLLLCTVAYAPFALTELPAAVPSARVAASVVTLGVVCTALAFVLFFALVGEAGPVRATVITYVNPAVAVLLGVVFLHESFGLATAAGFVLILGGSVLSARRPPSAPRGVPSEVCGPGGPQAQP